MRCLASCHASDRARRCSCPSRYGHRRKRTRPMSSGAYRIQAMADGLDQVAVELLQAATSRYLRFPLPDRLDQLATLSSTCGPSKSRRCV